MSDSATSGKGSVGVGMGCCLAGVGWCCIGVGALANSPGGSVGYWGTISVGGNQLTESVTRKDAVEGTNTL